MDLERNDNRLPEQEPAELLEAAHSQDGGTLSVEESCRQLTQYLEEILLDASRPRLDTARLAEPCRELGEALRSFHALAEELVDYSTQLSKGGLDQEFPESGSCLYGGLKNLHANLKHLTWQAGQVAKGDYSQHVSHLGAFSEAFNEMTRQLDERRTQLQAEIRRARRRAEIIDSYTEMLVELLSQREEWLLIVDWETREVVHCNKRPQGGGQDKSFCESCRHRLPIQSKLLEWDNAERYKIWELEEKARGACYRIISFPIEWRERPSCVHIVMDVTSEKMNARHLNAEVYHDTDTGIRNGKFLEEFMEQTLREKQDITLCYLDLEGVDGINETYGQKVGDAYIQNFVEIVRKNFRSGDTFARLKDDKFCLVLTGNVKHLIERKMAEILTIFQRDDDRIFCHRCNFKYAILEMGGEENTQTLQELLSSAEAVIRRKKRKRSSSLDLIDW